MAPSSEELEPLVNPGRFRAACRQVLHEGRHSEERLVDQMGWRSAQIG